MLLYVVLLTFLSMTASFGGTYLLLRRSPYGPYSLLLSAVSFQPFLIVCVTLLGYRVPLPIGRASVFVIVGGGLCLTLFAVLRYRDEIAEGLRSTWKATALIFGLAMASMTLATPLLFGSTSLAYIDWANGEFVNYAYLAHGFLGVLHDPNYLPGIDDSAAFRYGAELFLATVSVLTAKPPLLLVQVVAALHKTSAIVAFAVSCEFARRGWGLRIAAVIAADVGFAFATILSLNHVLAFLAAQAVTGSFILLALGLLDRGILSRRVQVFLAIHVLFIVITYAEALPFLCGFAAVVVVEALLLRRKAIAAAVIGMLAAGLFVNPVLLAQRLAYMNFLRTVVAGYNVLGDPTKNLGGYLAAALGFHYRMLFIPPLPYVLLGMAVLLSLVAIACAFGVATVRMRTTVFLVIGAILLLVHFNITGRVQPAGSAYYKSYKTIAALYFSVFFALAFLVDTLLRRRPWNRVARIPDLIALAGVCVFLVGNVFVNVRAASAIRSVRSIYREADIQRALLAVKSRGGRPLLILANDGSAGFWDLMASYDGTPRLLLDRKQAELVYHNHSIALIEPTAIPDPAVPRSTPQPEILFEGDVIMPRIGAYLPDPRRFDSQAVLDEAAPGLHLHPQAVVMGTPAFQLVEATLTAAVDPASVVGPRRPPVAIPAVPTQGRGADVVFTATYLDERGAADVIAAFLNVSSAQNDYGCYLSYTVALKQWGLARDDVQHWDTAVEGSGTTLRNANCTLDPARSSASTHGNALTLRVALTFTRAFAGKKRLFGMAIDQATSTTGWQPVGYWDVR
jgi:hypothetical protein